jgi:hypothetical protein
VKTDERAGARLTEEMVGLRSDADERERVVAAMIEGEQRTRAAAASAAARRGVGAADPRDRIRVQQDLAAMVLVRQADRYYRELDRKGSAVAGYERVVELFPMTEWAGVARQRLMEIN